MLHRKHKEQPMFIGFYKISVLLTYLSVISAGIGIYFALHHHILYAIICLIICGISDGFDGKVARACKRSDIEKYFGIQIDSLADLVAFTFLPVAIGYGLGLDAWYNVLVYIIYMLNGCIRLAYFNVIAEEKGKENGVTYYHGLPVTTAAVIFPFIYILKKYLTISDFALTYNLTMLFTAILFILNFNLKKPKGQWQYIFLIIGILFISYLLIRG